MIEPIKVKCPKCKCVIYSDSSELEQCANALKALYEETADYIRINHLGDVHHNRSMQDARAILKVLNGELDD